MQQSQDLLLSLGVICSGRTCRIAAAEVPTITISWNGCRECLVDIF
jgi:hypothetical protein